MTGDLTWLLLHQLSGLRDDIKGGVRIVVASNDQHFHRNCWLALLTLSQERLRQAEIPVVVEWSVPVISSRERESVRFLRQPNPLWKQQN